LKIKHWDLFFDDCSNNIDKMWIKFKQRVIQKTDEFVNLLFIDLFK